ncbi:MAG: AsmA family protein, partial [Deltaproteobacteria bacterium]|nr:AsmA family protein [Deltaproteobacteria bacterium]
MKAVKWIVGIVLGVIVLAVAGVAALVVLVDPNDYKSQIAAKVQETTGRTLDISGDIGWTFFPWLGMEAGAMTLGNAPGFEGKPFAGIERAQVRVALTPLFKGQVQVGTVILQGLVLNLARDKEGRTNWADLAARESQPAPPTTEESQPSAKALPALAVEGVRIENASLSWQDMVEGQEVVVDKLNLSLASLTLGKPCTVLFSGQVRTAKPETVTTIEISAKPTVQTDLKTVTIQDFVLKTDSRGQVFPAGRTEVTVRMEADLGQDQAKISGFELSTYGITVLAEVLAKMAGQKPDVDIKLQVPEFSPKALMAALGLPAPVTADPQALTRASTTFSATMRNGTLALTQNQRLDDTKIDLEAQILNFEGPAARFDLV